MRTNPMPLMDRRPLLHTRAVDETRTFLGDKGYRFDLSRRQAPHLHYRLNGVLIPDAHILYVSCGGVAAETTPGPHRTDHIVQIPLHGQLQAVVGQTQVDCDTQRGAIVSPQRERCVFRSGPDNPRLHVGLSAAALFDRLTTLLGESPAQPLEFAPAIDLGGGYGRSLAHHLLMAAIDLGRDNSVLLNPLVMASFQHFIMTGLLLSLPHNYADALRRRERVIAPRDVKRAIDYIEANLAAPIGLADIVRAAGIPGRTLLQHFKDGRGISPMRYLRNARMDKVREELLRGETAETITEIALRWGFSEPGRFSVAYRERFGERPSETHRRRRGATGTAE